MCVAVLSNEVWIAFAVESKRHDLTNSAFAWIIQTWIPDHGDRKVDVRIGWLRLLLLL